jgi:hypothetical protein
VKDTGETVGTAASELRDSLAAQLSSLGELGQTVRADVAQVQSSLATTMKEFAEDCQAGVRETFRKFDEHLGSAAQILGGTVSETNEQSREIRSAVAGLQQTIEEFDQTLAKALPVVEGLASLAAFEEDADTAQDNQTPTDSGEEDDGRVVN